MRRRLLEENLKHCYVAIDSRNGNPCALQWVLRAEENERIQDIFDGRFPHLERNELLFENGYVRPDYRGRGVMAAVIDRLCTLEARDGFKYALAFITSNRGASLEIYARAGFRPYMTRHDTSYVFGLFKRRRFEPIGGTKAAEASLSPLSRTNSSDCSA